MDHLSIYENEIVNPYRNKSDGSNSYLSTLFQCKLQILSFGFILVHIKWIPNRLQEGLCDFSIICDLYYCNGFIDLLLTASAYILWNDTRPGCEDIFTKWKRKNSPCRKNKYILFTYFEFWSSFMKLLSDAYIHLRRVGGGYCRCSIPIA